jgi:predicted Zn-dependent protease
MFAAALRRGRGVATRSLRRSLAPQPAPPPSLPRELHRDSRGYRHFDSGGGWKPTQSQLRVAGAVAAAGGVVYVTHLEKVPVTGRSHLVLCSLAQERALGEQAAAQVLAQYGGAVLPPSAPQSRRVARVGARLVEALREDERTRRLPHLATAKWTFTVIADDTQVNAFVVPGGHAFVFTGLLKLFPEDDALAMVLAHEAAHVVARHSAEKVSHALVGTLLKVGIAMLTGIQGPGDAIVDLGMSLPFSRRAELEADAIGILVMARACFDPAAAPLVFQRLGKLHKHSAPPAWLSTHPADSDRVKALRGAAADASRAYTSAGCDAAHDALESAGISTRRTRSEWR